MTCSRISPQEKGEMKDSDVSIHELTPHLTRVHVEEIQKATQGKTPHELSPHLIRVHVEEIQKATQGKTIQYLIQQIDVGRLV